MTQRRGEGEPFAEHISQPAIVMTLLKWLGRSDRLPMRLRLSVLSRLVSHRRLAAQPFEARLCDSGWRYRGTLADWMDWNAYFLGGYKRGVMKLIQTSARVAAPGADAVIADVGASVGQMAISASAHAARVIAIEPSPRIAAICRGHVGLNGLGDKVEVIEAALSDREGTATFYEGRDSKGTGTLRDDFNGDPNCSVEVPMRRGDAILASLGLDRLDVLKIDGQGVEASIAEGFAATISRYRPIVIVSLGRVVLGRPDEMRRISAVLGSGYRLFFLNNPFDPKVRIEVFDAALHCRGKAIVVLAVPDHRLDALLSALAMA
jgi:FkbM family methyltransferase